MYMADSPQFLNPKGVALQLMIWKSYYQTRLGASCAATLTSETEVCAAPASSSSQNSKKHSKKEGKKHGKQRKARKAK
jgi:hypothetical protein